MTATGQTAPDTDAADGRHKERRTYGLARQTAPDAPEASSRPSPEEDRLLLEHGPYVGARPFTAAESVLLAGREREADELSNMVVAGTLTVVYGASGVGKSSLLNAKLPERLDPMDPGWGQRVAAFTRWQPGFYQDLVKAIAPFAGGADLQPGFLATNLLAAVQADDCPLTLIFDQFEEYFLYNPNGDEEFAPELARLSNLRDSPVHIILSLRSDGLFLLDRLRFRIPDIFRRLYQVLPLSEAGARDAILQPLRRYNEAARRLGQLEVAVPAPDAPVVNALVEGADDGRIRGLLRRGKGIGAAAAGPVRIVAPFLQLTLLKLWVSAAGGKAASDPISVSSLLQLSGGAGIGSAEDPADAVGRIMQNHVAQVLRSLADTDTQRVCATIFSRMVTSEGGKVAVTAKTAATGLDEPDLAIAEQVLARLASMSGEDRLIRVAGEIEGDRTYEVQHDALGILLLNWVERWQREDAVRRERERFRARRKQLLGLATLAIGCIALSVTAIGIYDRYAATRDIVAQAEKFAAGPSATGYRQPILTLLAALDAADGFWTRYGLVDTSGLNAQLRQTLRRAPRWGGAATAAGIDDAGTRFALVGITNVGITKAASGADPQIHSAIYDLRPGEPAGAGCPGSATNGTAGAAGWTGGPAMIDGPDLFRPSPTLMLESSRQFFPGNDMAGFVRSGSCAVLLAYRAGRLAYWTWQGDGWKDTSLDRLIGNYDRLAGTPDALGQVWTEMLAGGLQVRLINQADRSLRTAIIGGGANIAAEPLKGTDFSASIRFNFPRLPILSPANDYSASFEQDPRNPLPGQLVRPVLALRATGDAGRDLRIQIAPPQRPGQYSDAYYRSLAAAFVVRDSVTSVVVRTPAELRVISNPDGEAPSIVTFPEPAAFASSMDTPSWLPPALAVARAEGGWRFAWMTDRGIAVLDSGDPATLRSDAPNDLHPLTAADRPLLTGIRDPIRLELSSDGQRLSLQRVRPGSQQRMEIWDLSKAWADRLEDPNSSIDGAGGGLRREACRIAAIEGSDRLQLDEMDAALHRQVRQPCAGIAAADGQAAARADR